MRAYLCLLAAVVTWGVEYPLLKRCAQEVGFLATGAVMFSTAALLLGLAILVRKVMGRSLRRPAARRIPYGLLILIGCVGVCVNLLGLWGIKLTSVPNASTLARSDALFSLGLSACIVRETIERRALLFVPAMLAGICLLTGILARSPELGQTGDYLMLGSAFCVALNAFIIKRVVQEVSGLVVGFFNSAIIAAGFLAAIVLTKGWAGAFGKFPRHIWLYLFVLGGLAFVFFIAYNTALRTVPVWRVRLVCLAIPVVATLCGWAWLGGAPSVWQWFGMALISGGAAGIIVVRRPRRNEIAVGK